MSELDWLDDEEERGLEGTTMTNRQWLIWQLIDMSDEELIKNLWSMCELCSKYVKQNKPCSNDCDSLLLAWLKQEHKEREE